MTPGIEAVEPRMVTAADVRETHARRLRALAVMAEAINGLKPVTVSGMIRVDERGNVDALSAHYADRCTLVVPTLGVTVGLTREVDAQLGRALRLSHYLFLGLNPISGSRLAAWRLEHPASEQLTELDDTSAKDWLTTAFAPYQQHSWTHSAGATRVFRLFCTPDFSGPRVLWRNQARGLRETLGWRPAFPDALEVRA